MVKWKQLKTVLYLFQFKFSIDHISISIFKSAYRYLYLPGKWNELRSKEWQSKII